MSQSIDRVLEVIDRGLATAPTTEPAYGTDHHPELCWRCQISEPGEGASGVCVACRGELLAEHPVAINEGEDVSVDVLLAFGRTALQAGAAMQTIARAFNDWIRELGPAIARIHAACVEWGLIERPKAPPVPFKRNARRYGR